ncbi:MAG: transposase, partial [Vicinamibacterales bacterium]
RAGALCARVDGFDLHGRVAFGAAERARLEELVRYCARPPLANDRLTKCADGHYLLRLKAPWRDGTTHLKLEPIELMERLAAQIPKPRINLVLYAGVLAPNAKLRKSVVRCARPAAPLPVSYSASGEEIDGAAKLADDIHNIQKMIEEKKKRDGTS